MITGYSDPSRDRPKLLEADFEEWRGRDGELEYLVTCQVHNDGRRSSSGLVEVGVHI